MIGTLVVDIVHGARLSVDRVLHYEFRRDHGCPLAEGTQRRDALVETKVDLAGEREPGVELFIYEKVLCVLVPCENDPVGSPEQIQSGAPVLRMEDQPVLRVVVRPHRAYDAWVQRGEPGAVVKNMVFNDLPSGDHVGQHGALQDRAPGPAAAQQRHAALLPPKRVVFPVAAAERLGAAEKMQLRAHVVGSHVGHAV